MIDFAHLLRIEIFQRERFFLFLIIFILFFLIIERLLLFLRGRLIHLRKTQFSLILVVFLWFVFIDIKIRTLCFLSLIILLLLPIFVLLFRSVPLIPRILQRFRVKFIILKSLLLPLSRQLLLQSALSLLIKLDRFSFLFITPTSNALRCLLLVLELICLALFLANCESQLLTVEYLL